MGRENLKLEDPGEEYTQWVAKKNQGIRAAMPQEVKDDPINLMFGTDDYELREGLPEIRDVFTDLVRAKPRWIGLEAPPGLYVTRYLAKDSPDPRTRIRFHV